MTTTTIAITTDDLSNQFDADGFVPGRPPHVHQEAIAIDREVAAEARCEECGEHGLEFQPYRPRYSRQSGYRCMAYCCRCLAAFEF